MNKQERLGIPMTLILRSIGTASPEQHGVPGTTVIPPSFFKNGSLVEGKTPRNLVPDLIDTPTTLGVRAVEKALSDAGISADQLTLLIGDGSTTLQPTPGESHRVGGVLGVKIPTYDVMGGEVSFVLHLTDLFTRKTDTLSESTAVLFCSEIPTQRLCGATTKYAFGDGAGACVVTNKRTETGPQQFEVIAARLTPTSVREDLLSLSLFGSLAVAVGHGAWIDQELLRLQHELFEYKPVTVVANCFAESTRATLEKQTNAKVVSCAVPLYRIGASPYFTLAAILPTILKDQVVAVMLAGAQGMMGYVVLRRIS